MGLGKTRTILESFRRRRIAQEATALLILAPKRVARLTWPAEIETWAPDFKYRVLPRDGWEWDDSDVYILNYEQVHKLMPLVRRTKHCPANYIVMDECDCAKSPSSKRMQIIRPLLAKAKFVVGMTGTPAPNGWHEIYGQFKAILQGTNPWSSKDAFEAEFFKRNPYDFSVKFKAGKEAEFFDEIRPYMLTQKSSDYLDLPDVTYVDIMVPLPKHLMALYRELETELLAEIEGETVTAINAGVLVNKLQQFTSGSVFGEERQVAEVHDLKLKALSKIKERPLLIIKHYTHTRLIPGAVQFSEDLLPEWNAKKVPMMYGHPKSMGVGLNLQKGGNTLVWHTPSFSLRDTQQTEARLHRTGQTEPVKVYRLLCPDTIDEKVVEALKAKDRGQNTLMTALRYLQNS